MSLRPVAHLPGAALEHCAVGNFDCYKYQLGR